LYEERIVASLVNEPLTIYAMETKTLNRSTIQRRIKGKLADKANLVERGYVQLERRESYKTVGRNLYSLTFKGLCAAFALGEEKAIRKLSQNWRELSFASELEMMAVLKLWLKYRVMVQALGFSRIYFTENWKEDFERYKYAPLTYMMNQLFLGTTKDSPYFIPIVFNFARLFKSYGLNDEEAELLSRWVHTNRVLQLNRRLIESMEMALNEKYERNMVEDISGYVQLGCLNLHLRFHVNQEIIPCLVEKGMPSKIEISSKGGGKTMEFLESVEVDAIGLSPSCSQLEGKECPYGTTPIDSCTRNRLKCGLIRELLGKQLS